MIFQAYRFNLDFMDKSTSTIVYAIRNYSL